MRFFGINLIGILIIFAVLGSAVGLEKHYRQKMDSAESKLISVAEIPLVLGDWKGQDISGLTERESKILKLDNYIRRIYRNSSGAEVFVYVGFWRKQSGEHQAAKHSPLMCLPANGWDVAQPSDIVLSLTSEFNEIRMRRLIAQYGKNRPPELFYYWFFSGSESYTDESEALLKLIKHSLVEQRSDGGIIEMSTGTIDPGTKVSSEKYADQVLTEFAKEFYPALEKVAR